MESWEVTERGEKKGKSIERSRSKMKQKERGEKKDQISMEIMKLMRRGKRSSSEPEKPVNKSKCRSGYNGKWVD